MKRLLIMAALVIVVLLVLIPASTQRVPPDMTGLRLDANGVPTGEIGPGRHWSFPPGGTLVLYPTEPSIFLFPSDEDLATYRLFDADGEEITTRFEISYAVIRGRAAELHGALFADGEVPDDPAGALPDTLKIRLRAGARRAAAGFTAEDLESEDGLDRLARKLTETAAVPGVSVEVRPLTGEAGSAGVNILMIGVDAGDWHLIDPLIAEGRMPNMAGLIDRGARADFHTIMPMLSPLLWTSIATSTTPDRHGILDFLTPDPATGEMVPVTSTLRREPAFWNYLTQYGISQAIVAWLATWPAEEVSGHMVTDRFGFLAYAGVSDDAGNEGMTWPSGYVNHARTLEVDPATLPASFWRRFINRPESELAGLGRGGFRKGDLENNLALTVAAALTSTNIAEDIQQSDSPRVMAVYYEMIDALGHLTMPYAPPRAPQISEEDYRRYHDSIDAGYELQDELIGRLLAGCDTASTVVMVLSDHGMRSGDARPRDLAKIEGGAAARWHRDPGILLLAGPGIRQGVTLATDIDILDIAPTLNSILGLPVPRSMQGHTITEAFDGGGAIRYAPTLVDTIELRPEVWVPQRRAPGTDTQGPALASLHNNLGLVYEAEGDLAAAETEYRKAVAAHPEDKNARNNLASILLKTRRVQEAGEILEELHRDAPRYFAAQYNLGVYYLRTERLDDAGRMFRSVLERDPSHARARVDLGHVLLRTDRPAEAEKEFRRALQNEPNLANAHFGLGLVAAQSGDLETAEAEFKRTLELAPDHRSAAENLRRIEEMKRGR